MLKRKKYVCVLGVAKLGGAIATRQYGRQTAPLDRRFLLIETFISKFTNGIASECHEKLTDRDNSSYKVATPDSRKITRVVQQTCPMYPQCLGIRQ